MTALDAAEVVLAKRHSLRAVNRTAEEQAVWDRTIFNPNQVKSAVDNNGDFSREENDIRYSVRAMNEAARHKDLLAGRIKGVFDDMSVMATNYFEAKPQREVRFNEMKAWIVPDTITSEDRRILEGNGQRIYTYKAGDETDRLRAVNIAADATGTRFSLRVSEEYADRLTFDGADENQAKSSVREWRNKRTVFTNERNGRKADVKSDWAKIFSTPAKKKSASYESHYAAANRLDTLFANGVKLWEEPPRNGSADIRSYAKYGCPFALGNDVYLAKLTVKEYADENANDGLYSVETISVEKISAGGISAGITSVEGHELDPDATAALSEMLTTTGNSIAYPVANVNMPSYSTLIPILI